MISTDEVRNTTKMGGGYQVSVMCSCLQACGANIRFG